MYTRKNGCACFAFVLGLGIALLVVSCGEDNGTTLRLTQTGVTGPRSIQGSDALGHPCSLALTLDADGRPQGLTLDGTFKVDYKIPTPLSAMYGVYYWTGHFATGENLSAGSLRWDKSWLNDDWTVSGRGKPVFWDGPEQGQTVTLKNGLAAPSSVTYSSTQRVAGVVPMVVITLECALR